MSDKPDVTLFQIGEEINPPEWHVRIRITALHPEDATLEAEVIKAEGYFAAPHPPTTGFAVGMKLRMEPRHPHAWIPFLPDRPGADLPWFELIAYADGSDKIFKHYR